MSVPLFDLGRRLHDSDIQRLERSLGQLPEDYRRFLLEHNGAEPAPNVFSVSGKEGHGAVRMFFGISSDPAKDLRTQWERKLKSFPSGCIPVALAEGGNLVVLRAESGEVHFWDHELQHPGEVSARLERVAACFSDFLRALQPFSPKDVALNPSEVKDVWVDPDFLRTLKRRE